jgi:hypothetical protein
MSHIIDSIPVSWKHIEHTADYISDCGRFIAVYKHSYGGYATYMVYTKELPKSKRNMSNTLCVGGLPALISIELLRVFAPNLL